MLSVKKLKARNKLQALELIDSNSRTFQSWNPRCSEKLGKVLPTKHQGQQKLEGGPSEKKNGKGPAFCVSQLLRDLLSASRMEDTRPERAHCPLSPVP